MNETPAKQPKICLSLLIGLVAGQGPSMTEAWPRSIS